MDSASPSMKAAFAAAANALTLLYKQGRDEARSSYETGAREALERVVAWAVRRGSYSSRSIPLDDLLAFLKEELDHAATGGSASAGAAVAGVPTLHSHSTATGTVPHTSAGAFSAAGAAAAGGTAGAGVGPNVHPQLFFGVTAGSGATGGAGITGAGTGSGFGAGSGSGGGNRKRLFDCDESLLSAFEDAMSCDSKRTHLDE